MKLNLGCGPVLINGWENVDGSLRAWATSRLPRLDRFLVRLKILPPTEFTRAVQFVDLQKRLPWLESSIEVIYLGEVLEHFTSENAVGLLKECFRILKPDAVIRIRVPDNAQFWRNYLSEFDATRARSRNEWTLAHTRWIEMFFRDICVKRRFFGSYGHFHKYMYDEISLIKLLEAVGFQQVNRRAFLDSVIADIRLVEVRADLIVEARKPARAASFMTSVAAVDRSPSLTVRQAS
jgi:predicted SAM-dependent methyltransferase